ncbi:hypothetical protein NECAME_15166 [Necator americanus]|uniref:Uncharacterized protein n=1 Tax=Necator americanus TaxID=51031 RepID=W2SLC0_NECAM|nr:hypothetical protein NECAME_15166 [Necator americanus]ETN69666.1 hypothetical protein NECAME_15166 [Necator americanus]
MYRIFLNKSSWDPALIRYPAKGTCIEVFAAKKYGGGIARKFRADLRRIALAPQFSYVCTAEKTGKASKLYTKALEESAARDQHGPTYTFHEKERMF